MAAVVLLYSVASFAGSERRAEYWGKADYPGRRDLPFTRLIEAEADVRPGMRVADVGAGGGFFTFIFARAAEPGGSVIATDVDFHMVEQLYLERLLRWRWNVFPEFVDEDEVGLGPSEFDLILIINTYQFRDCRAARNRDYFRQLARALRPDGRVIIADEFIHASGWAAPQGRVTPECGNLRSTELAAQAAPYLTAQRVTPFVLEGHRYQPRESPGYVMVLQRKASTSDARRRDP